MPKPTLQTLVLLSYWFWLGIEVFFVGIERDYFGIAKNTVKYARFVDEAILGSMLILAFVELASRKRVQGRLPFFLTALLIAGFLLSVVVNGVGATASVKFIALYFRFLLLFWFTTLFQQPTIRTIRAFAAALFVFAGAQFVLNAAWYLRISPIPNWRRDIPFNVDWASGSLLSQTDVAYINVFILLFCAHRIRSSQRFRSKVAYLALMGTGFAQLVWTDQKHIVALAALCFLLTYVVLWQDSLVKKVAGILPAFVLFLTLVVAREMQYGNYTIAEAMENSKRTFRLAFEVLSSNPKGRAYHDVLNEVPRELELPLVGAGPGKLNSKIAYENRPRLAQKYTFPYFEEIASVKAVATWYFPNTGFLVIMGELGWIGVLTYYGLHILLIVHVGRRLIRGYYGNHTLKESVAFAFCGYALFWVLETFILDQLFIGPGAPLLWVVGGILYQAKSGSDITFGAEGA